MVWAVECAYHHGRFPRVQIDYDGVYQRMRGWRIRVFNDERH
jgi:hypothetical protein